MEIKVGQFRLGGGTDRFAAQVCIPSNVFEALELGEYERPKRLPACLAWCIDKLGVGGQSWMVAWPADRGVLFVYFAKAPDAQAFVAEWNPHASAYPCDAGARHLEPVMAAERARR
jgi:hypothetical protein